MAEAKVQMKNDFFLSACYHLLSRLSANTVYLLLLLLYNQHCIRTIPVFLVFAVISFTTNEESHATLFSGQSKTVK